MKEAVQSQEGSKVSKIIGALSELENELDSLNLRVADMKKSLNAKAQKEIQSLNTQVTQMAIKEAEKIISEARSKAQAQAKKIASEGAARLETLKASVDSKFDEAVESVVSTILKP